jgi:molybdopterin converting factor subunit 1
VRPGEAAAQCTVRLVGARTSGYNFRVSGVSGKFTVNVLFFGRVRELTGLDQEAAELSRGGTLDDLFQIYATRFPGLVTFRSSLVASRNQEFASWDTPLCPGDDIAFLPPVSGG